MATRTAGTMAYGLGDNIQLSAQAPYVLRKISPARTAGRVLSHRGPLQLIVRGRRLPWPITGHAVLLRQ
jgi:hypothetical protein